MIQALDTVKAPYNLSTVAQITAAKVLRRPEYREHIAWILSERDRMYEQLCQLEGKRGFYCYPSSANYFFMRSNVENLGLCCWSGVSCQGVHRADEILHSRIHHGAGGERPILGIAVGNLGGNRIMRKANVQRKTSETDITG